MGQTPQRHLIVDGYNVIHALPDLALALSSNLELAVTSLVEQLRPIHDCDGYALTIVLDGKGSALSIEKPGNVPSFSVVYTPTGVTADAVIEQLVRCARQPQHITVATRDNMVRESICSSGGYSMPPEELAQWISDGKQRQSSFLEKNRQRNLLRESPWEVLDLIKSIKLQKCLQKPLKSDIKPIKSCQKPNQKQAPIAPRKKLKTDPSKPFEALSELNLPHRRPGQRKSP